MTIPIRFPGLNQTPFPGGFPVGPIAPSRSTSITGSDQLSLSPAVTAAQRELDTITAQLDRASQSRGRDDSGFTIQNTSTALTQFRVRNADLEPGEQIDVELDVTASAQRGAFFLSMGGTVLSLPKSEPDQIPQFDLTVGGNGSSEEPVELTFYDHTPLSTITAAINAHSDQTDVVAVMSGDGIVLRTTDYGADEFVSVSAFMTTTNTPTSIGVYGVYPNDTKWADPTSFQSFQDPAERTDHGQNVQAFLNGQATESYGTRITYTGSAFTTQLDLATGFLGKGQSANAQNLGSFLAFTLLHSDESPGPLDTRA